MPLDKIVSDLKTRIGDDDLVKNLFYSYGKISDEYVARDPVGLLQNTGLFVESTLRVIEHVVTGSHVPLTGRFDVDDCVAGLELIPGPEGLRIHSARLCRAIYDFRSRKTAVHLKAVDPREIDASLVFNASTWVLIEILRESGIPNPEESITQLFTRKVPLVQLVGEVLRTTNPKLSGAQRIILLLYSFSGGLSEDQIFEGTKQKIRSKKNLKDSLRYMDSVDRVHHLSDGRWVLFGRGLADAEKIISEFS